MFKQETRHVSRGEERALGMLRDTNKPLLERKYSIKVMNGSTNKLGMFISRLKEVRDVAATI